MRDCWNIIGVWGQGDKRCPKLERVIHCRNCKVFASFGRRRLDQEPDAAYLREWAENLSRNETKNSEKFQSFFIFRIGLEWLALSADVVRDVVEITDANSIHSLPHRPNKVLFGLVSVRGKLELCFSLGYLLGIDRGGQQKKVNKYLSPARLVVAEYTGQKFIFPVSQVYGSLKISINELRKLTNNEDGQGESYVQGVLAVEEDVQAKLLKGEEVFVALTKSVL